MRIHLITPAAPGSRAGNGATAARWAAFLRELGHRVSVATSAQGRAAADGRAHAVLALHAWRSHEAIQAVAAQAPQRPLIVALTGTDIYRFQYSDPEPTLTSMALAHGLIGLHDHVGADIPERFRDKLSVVHQSAQPLPPSYRGPPKTVLRVLVAGHLRAEKDALRPAEAARILPDASRIRVVNVGRAHDDDWARAARAEAVRNPRFAWRGEVAHGRVRRSMAASHVLAVPSVMEGGANVVSEACVAGLPVIASDIPGNRGLLGADYPALFPAGDAAALRELMLRVERDPGFRTDLGARCRALAPLFTPAAERDGLAHALARAGITG